MVNTECLRNAQTLVKHKIGVFFYSGCLYFQKASGQFTKFQVIFTLKIAKHLLLMSLKMRKLKIFTPRPSFSTLFYKCTRHNSLEKQSYLAHFQGLGIIHFFIFLVCKRSGKLKFENRLHAD